MKRRKYLQAYRNKIIIISYKISKNSVICAQEHQEHQEQPGRIQGRNEKDMHGEKLKKAGILILTSFMLLTYPCYAAEASVFGGSTEEASEEGDPDHHPEPPPAEDTKSEGQGTLSPPSEAAGESVFGSGQASEAVPDEELSALLSDLAFPSSNGSWSAYVCNLEKNTEGSINEHRMQAASLIKLFIMGAVYENYDSLTAQYGKDVVDNNLHVMIIVSDNDAANTLTGYLGGGDSTAGMNAVNDYCSRNGYTNTHMGRLLLHSNELDDNYTSPADCGRFLKKVYDGWMEGDANSCAMFDHLAAQERRNKIPAQMPEGVSVANKTGELADVENDAGIIYNTVNDLVIVFMSENLSEAGAAQSTISALSRQIYDYYQQ